MEGDGAEGRQSVVCVVCELSSLTATHCRPWPGQRPPQPPFLMRGLPVFSYQPCTALFHTRHHVPCLLPCPPPPTHVALSAGLPPLPPASSMLQPHPPGQLDAVQPSGDQHHQVRGGGKGTGMQVIGGAPQSSPEAAPYCPSAQCHSADVRRENRAAQHFHLIAPVLLSSSALHRKTLAGSPCALPFRTSDGLLSFECALRGDGSAGVCPTIAPTHNNSSSSLGAAPTTPPTAAVTSPLLSLFGTVAVTVTSAPAASSGGGGGGTVVLPLMATVGWRDRQEVRPGWGQAVLGGVEYWIEGSTVGASHRQSVLCGEGARKGALTPGFAAGSSWGG